MDIKFKDNSQLRFLFNQLEYIESTGTQYIDTGIKPNQDTRVALEFNDLNQSVAFLFGSRISSGNAEFGYLNGTSVGQGARYGAQQGTLAITHNVKLTLNANKTQWALSNGNTTTFQSTTFQSTQNCALFGFNNGGSVNFVSIRVYSCKIYDNNILIRDFIPAKDKDDIVCLYDTVSKTFFYNQGTGDFIAGQEVPSTVIKLSDNILLKTTTFYHKNTPNINGLVVLKSILNAQETAEDVVLNRIRVDIGNVSGPLSKLMQYAQFAGFNDNYEPQLKPRLVGTWTVNDWYTTAQLAQAQAAFDGLTIVGDPNYLINFNDLAVQVLDPNEDNYNPAVAIILQRHNLGITMTDTPLGHGRWFLTKAQAAAITDIANNVSATWISWFSSVTTINDNNNIVDGESHNFTSFNELKYFTNVNFRSNGIKQANLFYGCSLLEEVTIPSHINSISMYAFNRCGSLTKVNLDNITVINNGCFADCVNLPLTDTDVSKFTYIGSNAFENCTKATFTTINANVTSISESSVLMNTFANTASIPYLHFLSETPVTGIMCNFARNHIYNSFYGTTYKIYVGDGSSAAHDDAVLAAYQAASNWSEMVSYLDTWYNYLHPTT